MKQTRSIKTITLKAERDGEMPGERDAKEDENLPTIDGSDAPIKIYFKQKRKEIFTNLGKICFLKIFIRMKHFM